MIPSDLDLEKLSPLDRAIITNLNPFDSINNKTGNFWLELDKQHIDTVESIHQKEIDVIQDTLNLVKKDHCTRTILLVGDSGNGKSYLLKRLKEQFNDQAFFTYIEPCPSNDFIWRHTLRKTVDSLMAKPKGQEESQLILWLKNLSTFKEKEFWAKFLGKPGQKFAFVDYLNKTYSSGIYQSNLFFKVLYALVNPYENQYQLACKWLRGDEIEEEELKLLGIHNSALKVINDETAAKGILENFGRIADATNPIVLCFDQVELAPKLADGTYDLTGIFQVNSYFHNAFFTNFLIIISILSEFWESYKYKIQQAEMARIEQKIYLKQINLEQVKALWASRLASIHQELKSKPISPIAPLDTYWAKLESEYPGGKVIIRNSLTSAYRFYEEYKRVIIDDKPPNKNGENNEKYEKEEPDKILSAFQLIWEKDLKNTKETVKHINQFSEPELIDMIAQALESFPVKNIKPHLLTGANGNKSMSFDNGKKWGILWNEGAANGFTAAMNSCETALEQTHCDALVLIRANPLNKSGKGLTLYQEIFHKTPPNYHLIPTLEDIYYLRTYQKIANDTRSGDLVVVDQTINLATLHELVRDAEILNRCSLLQRLLGKEVVIVNPTDHDGGKNIEIKTFIINVVIHAGLLGKQALIHLVRENFPRCKEQQIEAIIDEYCKDSAIPISILNPKGKPEEQTLYYIPS